MNLSTALKKCSKGEFYGSERIALNEFKNVEVDIKHSEYDCGEYTVWIDGEEFSFDDTWFDSHEQANSFLYNILTWYSKGLQDGKNGG